MNAYCTIDQVAADLNIAVTTANTEKLTRCCEAAARAIDHRVDSPDPPDYSQPWNQLWTAINIPLAVLWFRSSDAVVSGVAGYDQPGQLHVLPSGAATLLAQLIPDKIQFGVA